MIVTGGALAGVSRFRLHQGDLANQNVWGRLFRTVLEIYSFFKHHTLTLEMNSETLDVGWSCQSWCWCVEEQQTSRWKNSFLYFLSRIYIYIYIVFIYCSELISVAFQLEADSICLMWYVFLGKLRVLKKHNSVKQLGPKESHFVYQQQQHPHHSTCQDFGTRASLIKVGMFPSMIP